MKDYYCDACWNKKLTRREFTRNRIKYAGKGLMIVCDECAEKKRKERIKHA